MALKLILMLDRKYGVLGGETPPPRAGEAEFGGLGLTKAGWNKALERAKEFEREYARDPDRYYLDLRRRLSHRPLPPSWDCKPDEKPKPVKLGPILPRDAERPLPAPDVIVPAGPAPDVVVPAGRGPAPAKPAAAPSPKDFVHRPTVPAGKSVNPKSTITGIEEDAAKRRNPGEVTPTPPEHKLSPPPGFRAPAKLPAPPPSARAETPSTITGRTPGGINLDVRPEGHPDETLDRSEVLKLLKKPGS